MNSSRLLQAGAAIATLAFVAYVLVTHVLDLGDDASVVATPPVSATQQPTRDILSYVPADTVYFFGGLESAPMKNMLDFYTPEWNLAQSTDLRDGLADDPNMPVGGKMLMGLFVEYINALNNLKTTPSLFGIGNDLDAAFYSVGTTPVMRIKLDDMNAFNTFIKKAETSVQITPTKESRGKLTFNTYSFSEPNNTLENTPADKITADEKNPTDIKLAISVNNGYALITLLTPLETPEMRDVILGIKKPAQSLVNTTILQDLKSKYNFHPAYLGYLSHEEIMKGLTSPDDNTFGTMMSSLVKTINDEKAKQQLQQESQQQAQNNPDAESGAATAQADPIPENPLASIQTDACRTELMAVTKLWPRTVFGYTELNLEATPKKMSMRMLVENTDAVFMQQLQKLRGFIPAHLRTLDSKPVLGFGLGFSIDNVTPVLSQLMADFTKKDYQCQPLADMKQNLTASNPLMALGMMTGMAAGVEGLSATVLDIDGSMAINPETGAPTPDIRSVDAMITLSAKDPQRLLLLAGNFMQGMPPIQPPADGTPIDLPIPLPMPELGTVKLALKGNHLVAYIGEKAGKLAQTLLNEPLEATGVFAFNMDFGKYMQLLTNAALAAEASATKANTSESNLAEPTHAGQQLSEQNLPDENLSDENRAALKEMAKIKMHIVESFDITPQGLSFDATMTIQQ